jgi:hypothetical protein
MYMVFTMLPCTAVYSSPCHQLVSLGCVPLITRFRDTLAVTNPDRLEDRLPIEIYFIFLETQAAGKGYECVRATTHTADGGGTDTPRTNRAVWPAVTPDSSSKERCTPASAPKTRSCSRVAVALGHVKYTPRLAACVSSTFRGSHTVKT